MDSTGLGFWRIAAAEPDRVAIIDDDGRVLPYGQLLDHSRAIARGLQALGLRRGDAVAAILPNHRAFLGTWSAALESGLYFVPVNSHLAPAEAAFVVTNSEAKVLVGHQDLADLCHAGAAEAGIDAEHRFAVGDVDGFRPFTDLNRWPAGPQPPRSPGLQMMYTSGTTGRPKGVRRPLPEGDPDEIGWHGHGGNLARASASPSTTAYTSCGGADVPARDRSSASPMRCTPATPPSSCAQWTPEQCLELVERHHVTNTQMVPTMFVRLLALP